MANIYADYPGPNGKYPLAAKVASSAQWSAIIPVAITILSFIQSGNIAGMPAWAVGIAGTILTVLLTLFGGYRAPHQSRIAAGENHETIDDSDNMS